MKKVEVKQAEHCRFCKKNFSWGGCCTTSLNIWTELTWELSTAGAFAVYWALMAVAATLQNWARRSLYWVYGELLPEPKLRALSKRLYWESPYIKVVSLRLTTYYECCWSRLRSLSAGCRYETKVLIGTFSSDNFSWLSFLEEKMVSKQKRAKLQFFFML